MSNDPGKIIRQHKMRQDYMRVTLTCRGEDRYQTTVTREVEGLSATVATKDFTAESNRQAIRKMQNWLHRFYPVKLPAKKLGDPFQ
jgi:hypothetical protein